MGTIDHKNKQFTAKIVYYGPGLCGKTTNLEYVNSKVPNTQQMMSLATEGDRTIFFDFLPLELGTLRGMSIKFKLYTVPGQVRYDLTRKMVLKGTDGVVFVADSQAAMMDSNLESWENLFNNLKELRIDIERLPIVIQYNKRDLPKIMSNAELDKLIPGAAYPRIPASAKTGEGVIDTLKEISKRVLAKLSHEYDRVVLVEPTKTPAKPAPSPPTPPSPHIPTPQPPTRRAPPLQGTPTIKLAAVVDATAHQPDQETMSPPVSAATPLHAVPPAPPILLKEDAPTTEEQEGALQRRLDAVVATLESTILSKIESPLRELQAIALGVKNDVDELRKKVDELAHRPAPDISKPLAELQSEIAALGEKVASPPRTDDAVSGIVVEISALRSAIERSARSASLASQPGPDISKALAELHGQMAALGEKVASPPRTDDAVSGIVAEISTLRGAIEQSARSAPQASQPAIDVAAVIAELRRELSVSEPLASLRSEVAALAECVKAVAPQNESNAAQERERLNAMFAELGKGLLRTGDLDVVRRELAVLPESVAALRAELATVAETVRTLRGAAISREHAVEVAARVHSEPEPKAVAAPEPAPEPTAPEPAAPEPAAPELHAPDPSAPAAVTEDETQADAAQPATATATDQDPRHKNAARVARVMVADLNLYYAKELIEGIKANDLDERLKNQLEEMRRTYDTRVPEDVRAVKNYLAEALESLVEKKRSTLT